MIFASVRSAKVERNLEQLAKGVTHRAPIHQKIGVQLYGITMRNFREQGNNGIKWAPLKAGGRWVGQKGGKGKSRFKGTRRLDVSARILQDTGAMRQSFLSFWDDDVAGVGAASFREHADIAEAHEFGVPSRNLPARPMLPTRERALEAAVVIYGIEMQRLAAKANA